MAIYRNNYKHFPKCPASGPRWTIRAVVEYLLGYCNGVYKDEAIAEAVDIIKKLKRK